MKPKLFFQPASPYRIQLDIDNNADLKLFYKYLPWLSCILHEIGQEHRGISMQRSRSGNWHVEIALSKPMPKIERICIAAIMGSDRARELCNWERYKFKSQFPILFIKKDLQGNKILVTKKNFRKLR